MGRSSAAGRPTRGLCSTKKPRDRPFNKAVKTRTDEGEPGDKAAER